MKTFLLALTVFALIVGLLILSGAYLARKTAALSAAASAFPVPDGEDAVPDSAAFYASAKEFSALWSSAVGAVRFIIGHEEAERIDDTFDELMTRYLLRDNAGYMTARAKLLRLINRLADAEHVTFDSIT